MGTDKRLHRPPAQTSVTWPALGDPERSQPRRDTTRSNAWPESSGCPWAR